MEVAVYVRKTASGQYRASTTQPFPAWAEGGTQSDAVEFLRHELEEGLRDGPTMVRLEIADTLPAPVWPQDEFTAAWLEGIRQSRRAADTRTDPWGTDELVPPR